MKAPITHTSGQDQVLLLSEKLWRTGEENSAFNIIVFLTVYKQGRSRALRGKGLCLALFSFVFLSFCQDSFVKCFLVQVSMSSAGPSPCVLCEPRAGGQVQCVLGALAVIRKDRDQQLAE